VEMNVMKIKARCDY